MIERPYFVYVAFKAQDASSHHEITGVSHYPLLDLKLLSTLGYDRLAVTAGPMPLARGMHEVERLKRRVHGPVGRQTFITRALGPLYQVLLGRPQPPRFDAVTIRDTREVILPTDEDLLAVTKTLRGRILFDRELRKALSERGYHVTGTLHDILQTLVLKGVIGRVPSVAIDRFRIPSCKRCGNRDVIRAACSSCSSRECFYCPECVSMGQARACRPLYYAPRDKPCLLSDVARLSHDPAGILTNSAKCLRKTDNNEALLSSLDFPNPSSDDLKESAYKDFTVHLDFELTKAQKHASQLIVDFLQDSSHDECLVFAVCGAGKTEVVFQGIAHVLRHGGKVLFAVPRSDVVAEVVLRIAAAIPGARVLELRGNAKLRYRDADIVVATTHQTIRFFRAFDLVVLDEVDAFPYRGSAILQHSVRRATASRGKTVFMTATPDRAMLRKANQNRMAIVRISARHHGRPLPEPAIIQVRLPLPGETSKGVQDNISSYISSLDSNRLDSSSLDNTSVNRNSVNRSSVNSSSSKSRVWQGNDKAHQLSGNGLHLPDKVMDIIERSLKADRKMFVFVPTVKLSRLICMGISTSLCYSGQSLGNPDRTLLRNFPQLGTFPQLRDLPQMRDFPHVREYSQPKELRKPRIASIHAGHPNRESNREAFKTGNIDIIVSTSILERGITVANADVLVLYADYERIFDTATLTQMAGRAGRARDDTEAKVYFVAEQITTSMRTAIRLIQDMNRHAAEAGYLHPSHIRGST